MEYGLDQEKQSKLTFDDLDFGELFVWEKDKRNDVAMKIKVRQMESASDTIKDGYAYLDRGDVWVIGGYYSRLASDTVIRVASNEIIFNTVSN